MLHVQGDFEYVRFHGSMSGITFVIKTHNHTPHFAMTVTTYLQ